MTRKIALHTTVAAAAFAALTAPAFAQITSNYENFGESPAITDTGADNAVDSQGALGTGNADSRYGLGVSAYDENEITLSQEAFQALANTRGAAFVTSGGDQLGMINEVRFNDRGFPELVVDLNDTSMLDAERLVITVQPGNVMMQDGKLFLSVTVDELMAKVQAEGVRNDETAEITIF